MASLGSSYFSLSENFDYQKYLEERSHFAALQEDLSADIREQTRGVTGRLDGIRDSTDALSHAISDKLGNIESLITEQTAIIDFQFTSLIVEQRSMNAKLDELIETVKAPSYTAALEHFSRARDCLRKKLFADAYKEICYAIDGSSHSQGYPYDYRFHTLKGILELGSFENFEANFVDPAAASLTFQRAGELSRVDDPLEASLSYSRAAWAEYCAGNQDTSKSLLKTALSIDPDNSDAHYNYGRILVDEGNVRGGGWHIELAVQANILFLETAKNDPITANRKELISELDDTASSMLQKEVELLKQDLEARLSELPADMPQGLVTRIRARLDYVPPDSTSEWLSLRNDWPVKLEKKMDEMAQEAARLKPNASGSEYDNDSLDITQIGGFVLSALAGLSVLASSDSHPLAGFFVFVAGVFLSTMLANSIDNADQTKKARVRKVFDDIHHVLSECKSTCLRAKNSVERNRSSLTAIFDST